MRKAEPISDIQPKAVMSAEEITAWEALPASEQLARLRAARQAFNRKKRSKRGQPPTAAM